MTKCNNPEEWQQLINDCETRESLLSDWEATFIDSISYQLAKGSGLTEKQEEALSRIWEKATSNG